MLVDQACFPHSCLSSCQPQEKKGNKMQADKEVLLLCKRWCKYSISAQVWWWYRNNTGIPCAHISLSLISLSLSLHTHPRCRHSLIWTVTPPFHLEFIQSFGSVHHEFATVHVHGRPHKNKPCFLFFLSLSLSFSYFSLLCLLYIKLPRSHYKNTERWPCHVHSNQDLVRTSFDQRQKAKKAIKRMNDCPTWKNNNNSDRSRNERHTNIQLSQRLKGIIMHTYRMHFSHALSLSPASFLLRGSSAKGS